MRYIIDFHIHSRYSRACSKNLTVESIAKWCEKKGIDIISTADFTHPLWIKELENNLEPAEDGLYKLRNSKIKTRFMVATELSCIYKRGDKTRRVHLCILMPSLKSAKVFTQKLINKKCNISSDGRPILGIDSQEIVKMVLETSQDAMVIPAHIWTPWFSVFGSQSGFDTLEDCFGEYTKYIYALETGLSSDPLMNWRLPQLDKYLLLSNSDAHSLEKLGREANVFEFQKKPSYFDIIEVIKTKDKKRFLYTIEFFPEEGKYYQDGHRDCNISLKPKETKQKKYICPKCNRKVTVGVLHRVDNLGSRNEKEIIKIKNNFIPYKSIIPLIEIISECFSVGVKSKKVLLTYEKLINECGSEFDILLNRSLKEIKKYSNNLIAEAIDRVRKGKVIISPGYDGEFGVIKIFNDKELKKYNKK